MCFCTYVLPTCVQADVFCVNVQVCPECVLYLSGQEITLFSRRRQWGHKGLWVIGNPDGCAWTSWKKRLPQRSNRTHSTMLMSAHPSYSFTFPILFPFSSWFLPLSHDFYLLSSSFESRDWQMTNLRDRKQCIGWIVVWVGPQGPINKIGSKGPLFIRNINHTISCSFTHSLRGTTSLHW